MSVKRFPVPVLIECQALSIVVLPKLNIREEITKVAPHSMGWRSVCSHVGQCRRDVSRRRGKVRRDQCSRFLDISAQFVPVKAGFSRTQPRGAPRECTNFHAPRLS